ncbi:hypothetical protein Rsub_04238 [Raphidocelis subcapitata]|uniref:DNA polymerase delta subunit 4 n=1 Tax=Raphidocelis subcapitata TaxID=307507 RepID=A0A2V0NV33_9CHLO|nr:hypothetical protein Rsub_04238 [Raphidocelis subcapitata]|eukprot:GBF91498.1 hypothetical protein Rsub_04238 [Raphidocelis subcapitata]
MRLSDFFKQRKRGTETAKVAAPPAASEAAPAAPAAQAPAAAQTWGASDRPQAGATGDADTLRAFDLSSKFGPCTGMTRLERWERASRLGLQPPEEVRRILVAAGADSPANLNIWHGRV